MSYISISTVRQEIFAANKFRVFVVRNDPRNYSSANFNGKWLLTESCTTFAYRNCLHAKIDHIQNTILRLLVYLSLGLPFKL